MSTDRDLIVSIGAMAFESGREEILVEGGGDQTIAEILGDVPDTTEHEILILDQGELLPPENWGLVKPQSERYLYVNVLPRGRSVLRTFLVLVVAFAAAYVAGPVFGLEVGTLAYAATTAGISLAGALAINVLFPPEGFPQRAEITQDPQRFGIRGTRNQIPDNTTPVMIVMGKHRVTPYFATQPYAYVVDSETQGYKALYDFGYGPIDFDRSLFKFGDTLVANFGNVTIATHEGVSGTDSQIAQFSERHAQSVIRKELRKEPEEEAEWSTYTFRPETTKISAIVVFGALVEFDDRNNRMDRTVAFEVETRRGDGVWSTYDAQEATAQTTSQYFLSIDITIPASALEGEFRIRRTTDTDDDVRIRDRSILVTLDFISPGHPVLAQGRALVYLDIEANEDLNNTIRSFNAVVTRKVPRWDDGAWTEPSTTGATNPAWQIASILRGPGTAVITPDANIETDSLTALAAHCDTNDYEFNAVWTDQRGLWDRLNQVAAAGRANLTLFDGTKYGVVIDQRKTVPVDLITPRDTLAFQGQKIFLPIPDGFRAIFNNRDNDYRESEIVVYRDGQNAANSTDTRSIDMRNTGATTVAQVHRFLRYLMAVTTHRPEAFTVTQDIKHLRLQRGDYVDLTYDSPLLGLGQGRLRRAMLDEQGRLLQFSLDEKIDLVPGETHTARFQNLDGEAIVVPIVENREQTFAAQTVSGRSAGMYS